MGYIQTLFKKLRKKGKKALIPFIMGGCPDLSTTPDLILALEDAGADIIEVGIPFSDPLADGPIIQEASAVALAKGASAARILDALFSVRKRLNVPLVCLSYLNPLMQFGQSVSDLAHIPFLHAASKAGFAGLIVPDLPIEEGKQFCKAAALEGISTIFLAAPTSPPERLRAIARLSEGFIYYVSVTGTTGTRRSLAPSLVQGIRQLKLITTKPVCVGFGISSASQAHSVAEIADGVIVGSALIKRISQEKKRSAILRAAGSFVKQLRRAI